MMEMRLNHSKAAPGAFGAMMKVHRYVERCGLERTLLELVKTRASQINGCAYCLDMHTQDARSLGESEQRLYALSAWRETPFYTDRERAGLAWTEAITLIREKPPDDSLFEQVRTQFTETELVNLTLAIVTINGWNRFAIAFRAVPGQYRPSGHSASE